MNFDIFKDLEVEFDDNLKKKFLLYINLFKDYNSHTNLISKNDEIFLFEKHIYDSLGFNLFTIKYGLPKSIMDIGTGGGFPSVPLSLIYKNTKILAVDSTSKKINFIKEVKNKLDIANLEAKACRIEDLPSDLKGSFDVVTSRALGDLRLILEYGIPYLKVGGYFIAYKSANSDNELTQAQNALITLNTKLVDIIDYKLPLKENFDRKLMVFKKIKSTPNCYPRAYNVIKNKLL